MLLIPHGGTMGMIAGYLSMIVGLSFVFVGVKRYRDTELGGVIRFWPAFALGTAIALVASLFYVLSWEVYMWRTNYSFMAEYAAQSISAMKASGASASEVAQHAAETDAFARDYAKPLFRVAVTFSEIAPVALLVPLVTAALLRRSSFLPAKA